MVAGLVGSAIGALASSFIANASSENQMGNSVVLQKDLMDHQASVNWKYYKKDLKTNKYLLGRSQLEAANYNPYLAIGQASGSPSWTSQASVSDQGAGANTIGAFNNATQQQAVDQQGRLNEAQIEHLGFLNESASADALLKAAQSGLTTQNTIRQVMENANYPEWFKKQMDNLVSQTTLNRITGLTSIENSKSQRMMASASVQNADNMRNLVRGQVQLMRAQGVLTGYQSEEILRRLPYVKAQELWNMYQKFGIGTGAMVGGITGLGNFGLNLYNNLPKQANPVGFR